MALTFGQSQEGAFCKRKSPLPERCETDPIEIQKGNDKHAAEAKTAPVFIWRTGEAGLREKIQEDDLGDGVEHPVPADEPADYVAGVQQPVWQQCQPLCDLSVRRTAGVFVFHGCHQSGDDLAGRERRDLYQGECSQVSVSVFPERVLAHQLRADAVDLLCVHGF